MIKHIFLHCTVSRFLLHSIYFLNMHLLMQFVGLHWCCHELPLWTIHFRCRIWSQPQVASIFWYCNNWQVCLLFPYSSFFCCSYLLSESISFLNSASPCWTFSSKPSFFHDDNRAGLFEVEPDSGKLLNADIQASEISSLFYLYGICSLIPNMTYPLWRLEAQDQVFSMQHQFTKYTRYLFAKFSIVIVTLRCGKV